MLSSLLHRLLLCVSYSQYVMGMPVIMIFSMLINQSLLFLLVLTDVFWPRLWPTVFYTGGNLTENVSSYVHLGHVITAQLDDFDDILKRRNNYIGQVNNVACYFDKLTWKVRLKLHHSYCSSLFGCELSGPLTVVLLSGFVLHGERAWGVSWISLMLPIAICCHCCPTLCQFLMRFVDVLQSSYCLVCIVGQHSFVQLRIMAYLLVLTRLLVVMLCFYVTVFISQQLISNLARLPI